MSLILERVMDRPTLLLWWERVRVGLVENVQYHGEITAPERTFSSVTSGNANLYLAFDAEDYLGFVVTTVEGVGDRAEPYLYLWQVHLPGLLAGRIGDFVSEIDRLAGEQGLTRIRMNTSRNGWGRLMERFAEPALVEYERRVPHG